MTIYTTPKMSLDFTSGVLDPIITFTRTGTTATRVNSTGLVEGVAADAARFDYDPVTLACKGLLVEGTRINICPYSEAFGSWSASGTTTVASDFDTAPDGTNTADKITGSTSNSARRFVTVALTSGSTYGFSLFVKNIDNATPALRIINPSSSVVARMDFNFSSGITIETSTGAANVNITTLPNNWYRISATYVATVTGTHSLAYYADRSATTKSSLVWGAQFEEGPSVTSYIPNTGAGTTTRNADDALITGGNFSSFWQANRGGVIVRALPSTVSGTRPLVQFDDGTANEIIALRGNTTNPELYIVDGGAPQAQIDAGTIAANTAYSLTGWWATNDCKARKDLGAVVTDTTATIPTVTQARLGSDGTNYLNGHLATINYYDQFSGQIYTRRKNKVIFTVT